MGTIHGRPSWASSSRSLRAISLYVIWCFALLPSVDAQPEDRSGATGSPAGVSEEETRQSTLVGILESIAVIETEIEGLEETYRAAETEEQRGTISQQIEEREQRIEDLDNDFSVLATGLDPRLFFEQPTEELDWREELKAIFSPVISELKQASAYPRALEALRNELILSDMKLPMIEDAISSLSQLSEISEDAAVQERLGELTDFWTQQLEELSTHYEATQQRLEEKEQEQIGFGHAAGKLLQIFFKRRFVNLLGALLAFSIVFFFLRLLHRLLHKYVPAGGSHARQFAIRFVDIIYYLFTVAMAIGALLAVLYLSADWVLLTLAILVLIGLAWTVRNTIPHFLEQAKLLLNLGAVREGERLMYEGIPWNITSLNLFSELENPALRGGTYRLPLKDLVGLRSRVALEDEPWFPSQVKDWVVLSDGTYGEVVEQTPEAVVVSTFRGSLKHYPVLDYLGLHPKNLSTQFFSVNHIVGLDYRYRDIIMTEVPAKIKAALEEGFRQEAYGEHLMQVVVEFKEMNASSLDVLTIVKFTGDAASEYTEIGWKLQQVALEVCNENGWEIPFPQLTVHRAAGASPDFSSHDRAA